MLPVSQFSQQTLCESGVMWIARCFVTYLSIAFHIYLLIIIHEAANFAQDVFDKAKTSALSLAHINFNLETDKFLAEVACLKRKDCSLGFCQN
jgi:hypothetical protein